MVLAMITTVADLIIIVIIGTVVIIGITILTTLVTDRVVDVDGKLKNVQLPDSATL